MNIDEVHWNFSDNGTKEPAKSRFWNFYNFWTAWNFLMRFSLLCTGERALSFYICVFFYTGVSLTLSLLQLIIVLLVKRNTLILSYFHQTFIFLLLMSVTFYRCIEKSHSKSFLPYFLTFMEILLKSYRKITADICLYAWLHKCLKYYSKCRALMGISYLHIQLLYSIITFFVHITTNYYVKAADKVPFKTSTLTSGERKVPSTPIYIYFLSHIVYFIHL